MQWDVYISMHPYILNKIKNNSYFTIDKIKHKNYTKNSS